MDYNFFHTFTQRSGTIEFRFFYLTRPQDYTRRLRERVTRGIYGARERARTHTQATPAVCRITKIQNLQKSWALCPFTYAKVIKTL